MTSIPDVPALRERKKERTRADLAAAARQLTAAHGLEAVTIQQIADAADVSTRTFFNYFRCKEEAVVGVVPGQIRDLADAVTDRPDREFPVVALIETLLEVASDPAAAEGWEQRSELVDLHPALLPRHLAAMAEVEEALTVSIAARLGTDPVTDPTPAVLVASVVSVMRATFSWWMRSDRHEPLRDVLERMYGALTNGFATTRPPGDGR